MASCSLKSCYRGHNGLVAAAYLAESGSRVCVLERRHILGGAAVTEEINPGFLYSRASYLFSLFRPQIVKDLDLKRHGLKFHFRNPSSFTPLLDGRYLAMGPDMKATQAEIAKFSFQDAEAYLKYEEMLSRLTTFFEPLLDNPPPSFQSQTTSWKEMRDRFRYVKNLITNTINLGSGVMDLHEIMTAPASRILNRWFKSEPLKSTLATDAIIGAMTSPTIPGSGYVLFHHVMGEVDCKKGAWAYVEGGMGAVSKSIAAAAIERGVHIYTGATVKSIMIENDHAKGVELTNGQRVHARSILSNATPHVTFLQLCNQKQLPEQFHSKISSFDYTSPVSKINVSLSELPQFKCYPTPNNEPGPPHFGTIHFTENCEQIEDAYHDALHGFASKTPIIEMTIPSALDRTISPPGQHVASLFVQYTPYFPKHENGEIGWTDQLRKDFAKRCFSLIEQYCPGFEKSILHYELLAPPDLENIFGLTGGNIFHGSMGLDQLYWLRPASGWATHRTPIKGLYLAGSGAHPGGGVMGAPGRNCAQVVIWDQEH